jgi:hypothetical protein
MMTSGTTIGAWTKIFTGAGTCATTGAATIAGGDSTLTILAIWATIYGGDY